MEREIAKKDLLVFRIIFTLESGIETQKIVAQNRQQALQAIKASMPSSVREIVKIESGASLGSYVRVA
jgi:hypothetical protein